MESIPQKFTNWVIPDIKSHEMGEIDRVAKTFDISKEIILESIKDTSLTKLEEQTWEQLENTDSYEINNIDDIETHTNHSLRDHKTIIDAFTSGKSMQAPIILKTKDKFHLISGNTRLMVARALKITPHVIICEI